MLPPTNPLRRSNMSSLPVLSSPLLTSAFSTVFDTVRPPRSIRSLAPLRWDDLDATARDLITAWHAGHLDADTLCREAMRIAKAVEQRILSPTPKGRPGPRTLEPIPAVLALHVLWLAIRRARLDGRARIDGGLPVGEVVQFLTEGVLRHLIDCSVDAPPEGAPEREDISRFLVLASELWHDLPGRAARLRMPLARALRHHWPADMDPSEFATPDLVAQLVAFDNLGLDDPSVRAARDVVQRRQNANVATAVMA